MSGNDAALKKALAAVLPDYDVVSIESAPLVVDCTCPNCTRQAAIDAYVATASDDARLAFDGLIGSWANHVHFGQPKVVGALRTPADVYITKQ